jgi:molybdate/tungstate transport system substrate-binding protein
VAEQHGHRFLELPPEIDLGSSDYIDSYQRVKVKLDFQRFLSVEPEFLGQPIVYGATIPQNAPHPDTAAEFVKFITSPQGQQIFLDCNQPPVVPAETDNPDCLPNGIRDVIE